MIVVVEALCQILRSSQKAESVSIYLERCLKCTDKSKLDYNEKLQLQKNENYIGIFESSSFIYFYLVRSFLKTFSTHLLFLQVKIN